ncbi:uncharacterized protein ACJ7VT_018542 [Polymixia lowei]
MSEDLYANTTKTVKFERDEQEDRIVDIYVSADNLNVYDHPQIEKTTETTETTHSTADEHPAHVFGERPLRAAAMCLGLLSLLLLAGIIGLGVHYNQAERNQKINDSAMIQERETNDSNLTRKRDQLQTSYNILVKERDQLQTSYNILVKERDQLQNLTSERDQLQTSYNTMTLERDQLKISYNNVTSERDQLRTISSNLSKQRDQLQRNNSNLIEERDQLQAEVARLNVTVTELSTKRCPEEWTLFGSSCYYSSTETKTWQESRQDCQRRGADLIIINSGEKQTFIKKFHERIWIGLSDLHTEGRWKWVDGSNLINGRWAPGEPNDSGGEDCAELVNGLGAWNDLPCSNRRNWVCEQ